MKVRGTTITTPIPKSVYFLDYHDGYGWGDDGLDYQSAEAALVKGQMLVLRRDGVAYEPTRYYVCTSNADDVIRYLTFMGVSNDEIEEVLVFSDGQIDFFNLSNTSYLQTEVDVLKSRMDSMPYKELTGTSSNPIVIRNLESGNYVLNGTVKYFSSGSATNVNKNFYYVYNAPDVPYTYTLQMIPATATIQMRLIGNAGVYKSINFSIENVLDRLSNIETRLAALEA